MEKEFFFFLLVDFPKKRKCFVLFLRRMTFLFKLYLQALFVILFNCKESFIYTESALMSNCFQLLNSTMISDFRRIVAM